MHTMSTELAGNGITVNNIAPGPIVTPMAEARLDAAQRNAYIHAIPQRRLGRPENVAEAAVFLASDAASYISGHTLNVDGGYRTAGLTFSLGTTRAPEVSDFEIS
ncbi:3-oxoacyl-[acyl-carrier-protein] reductase [compost metagenome]